MILTNPEVLKALHKVACEELYESIEYYPEDERDGRDDWQMLADEAGYILSCYEEDGHCFKDDLEWAREKLRETKHGKIIPLDPQTFKPLRGYYPSDIDSAESVVKEYNALKRLIRQCQKKDITRAGMFCKEGS